MKHFTLFALLCSLNLVASETRTVKLNNNSPAKFNVYFPGDCCYYGIVEIAEKSSESMKTTASQIALICIFKHDALLKKIDLSHEDNSITIDSNLVVQHNEKIIHQFVPNPTRLRQY